MANIRQRRMFPVKGAYEGTQPGAEFHYITSTWMESEQVGCRCEQVRNLHRLRGRLDWPTVVCTQCREDGRTSALKALPRWTHVRRVVGRREMNGSIRYDWYGFHEGWRA